MLDKIDEYLKQFNLDLRKSNNGRFMDQKVTPDVLSFVADCILNFTSEDINKEFTARDIWESDYFNKNVEMIFGKPPLDKKTTENEYNKFAGQPIKTFEYAKILETVKRGKTNYFKIKNLELLEFISIKDKNAYLFLTIYLKKVLTDSGFMKNISNFIKKAENKKLTKTDFILLKTKYIRFIIGNTPINGSVEVRRILPKVLNIFSVENNIPGTIKGHLSKRNIYYSDLMYNRINFRDLKKEKGLSRQEADIGSEEQKSYEEYNEYLITKAMNFIKRKYKESEVKDGFCNGPAVYVHHIFSKSEHPEISHFLENLIKLTSEQHYSHAHPIGNTHTTDKDYQLVCLLSKSNSIEKSLIKGEFCYSKNSFIFVINTGLKLDEKQKLPEILSFDKIRSELQTLYKMS